MRGRPSSNPLTVSPIHTSTWCSRRRSGFSRVDVVVEVEPFDVELSPTHEQFPPIHPVRRHLRSPQLPQLGDTGDIVDKNKSQNENDGGWFQHVGFEQHSFCGQRSSGEIFTHCHPVKGSFLFLSSPRTQTFQRKTQRAQNPSPGVEERPRIGGEADYRAEQFVVVPS